MGITDTQTNPIVSLPMTFDRVGEQLDTRTRHWFEDTMREYRHSIRGRITSIKISVALLERKSGGENSELIARLKAEVDDLTRLIEILKSQEEM